MENLPIRLVLELDVFRYSLEVLFSLARYPASARSRTGTKLVALFVLPRRESTLSECVFFVISGSFDIPSLGIHTNQLALRYDFCTFLEYKHAGLSDENL